ncbi:unnamed protein product [Caenorhabditis angaria]|uniref:Uncharacterized protein n=1 Tax=Caenorhabditis angaria TaxID=860376 RepID=A0A9P1N4A4_9PELO|nr:unnamed protein product [Caenorhabditis angaria]
MPRRKSKPRVSPAAFFRVTKRNTGQAETVWEHLRNLMSRELHEEVILMYEVTNLCDADSHFNLPTTFEDTETFFEIGRAYFLTHRYALCDHIYKTMIETFPMPKFPEEQTTESDFCEHTVKYARHECLMKMKKLYDAYACLTTIENPTVPLKLKAAYLSVVNASAKKPRERKTVYKWKPVKFDENQFRSNNPSKNCNSSLGAASQFVRNQKSEVPRDFCEKFAQKFAGNSERHNVEMWLKAQQAAGKRDFSRAILYLKRMTHANSRVQSEMGKFYFKLGRKDQARRVLQAVFERNVRWVEGMDLLAFLLWEDENKFGNQLEHLSRNLLDLWPDRAETFIAAGYMTINLDWYTAYEHSARALGAAEVATEQNARAILLRAQCLIKMKRANDAMRQLQEGVSRDKNNVELFRELCLLMLEHDDHREAKNQVTNLVLNNPNDLNAKILKVHVFISANSRTRETHNTNTDIIGMMEEILQEYPHSVGDVIELLDEYYKSNLTEPCKNLMELIEKHKKRILHDKMRLYHNLQAEYNLRCQKPTKSYKHAIAAQILGEDVNGAYMSRIEQEYRNNCQHLLDEQFSICSTPPSSAISSPNPKSSRKRGKSSTSSCFENTPSCSYNLRSRQSSIGTPVPPNLSNESIDRDLDLNFSMTTLTANNLRNDFQIFSPDLEERQSSSGEEEMMETEENHRVVHEEDQENYDDEESEEEFEVEGEESEEDE